MARCPKITALLIILALMSAAVDGFALLGAMKSDYSIGGLAFKRQCSKPVACFATKSSPQDDDLIALWNSEDDDETFDDWEVDEKEVDQGGRTVVDTIDAEDLDDDDDDDGAGGVQSGPDPIANAVSRHLDKEDPPRSMTTSRKEDDEELEMSLLNSDQPRIAPTDPIPSVVSHHVDEEDPPPRSMKKLRKEVDEEVEMSLPNRDQPRIASPRPSVDDAHSQSHNDEQRKRSIKGERKKGKLRRKQELFLKKANAQAIRVLRRDDDWRLATEEDRVCLQKATGVYARLYMEFDRMEVEAKKRAQETVQERELLAAAIDSGSKSTIDSNNALAAFRERVAMQRENEISKRNQIEALALIRENRTPTDELADLSSGDKVRILQIRGNVPFSSKETSDDEIAEALEESYAEKLF